jgi:hypothetical protein
MYEQKQDCRQRGGKKVYIESNLADKGELFRIREKALSVWHTIQCTAPKDTGSSRHETITKTKLSGLSPQANYNDRATDACRRN